MPPDLVDLALSLGALCLGCTALPKCIGLEYLKIMYYKLMGEEMMVF